MADDKSKDKKDEGGKPFRGLGFLGRCVNITVVSPLQPGKMFRAGGGVLSEGVVMFKPTDCTEDTSNSDIKLPPKVHYNPLSNGIQEAGETFASSAEELMNRFASSVQVEGESAVVSFKASLDYQNSAKSMSGSSSFISFSQAFFEDEEVELDEDFVTSERLNTKLVKSLKDLPKGCTTDSDRQKYVDFIKKYGTHFIWSAVFGGRVYQQTQRSMADYSKARSEALKAETSLNVSSLVYSASVSASMSKETSSASSGSKTFFQESATWYGGKNRDDFYEWAETIAEDPQPLKLRLRRLTTLFQQDAFKDIPDLQMKGRNLDWCVDRYIDEHSKPYRVLSGKKFYLASGKGSELRYLTIGSGLKPEDSQALASIEGNRVAWRMRHTGLKDEYHLESRAPLGRIYFQPPEGTPFFLGATNTAAALILARGEVQPEAWRFIHAEGSEDAYYVQFRAATGSTHPLHDGWLAVSNGELQLVSHAEIQRRTAWRLEPQIPNPPAPIPEPVVDDSQAEED
jgi:hypothetical protein